jgi:hypothetical protein
MGTVTKLPTAASRQVVNPVKAARAFRQASPWPGVYVLPFWREHPELGEPPILHRTNL